MPRGRYDAILDEVEDEGASAPRLSARVMRRLDSEVMLRNSKAAVERIRAEALHAPSALVTADERSELLKPWA